MQFLDLYFRLASVTLLLVMIILIMRDAWDVRPARFGALLAFSLIDVVSTDGATYWSTPIGLQYLLSLLSVNTAIFIWWFSLSLFDDDFRLGRLEWGVAALWFALGIPNFNAFVLETDLPYPWTAYARSIMAVMIVAHIVYRALAGRRTDLVEKRRRARILFAFAIAALFLIDLWSEFAFGFHIQPIWFSAFEHGAFFGVIVWGAFWLLRFDKQALMFDRPAPQIISAAPALNPKEQLLHKKLIDIIKAEKAYLEPDLSISALADRMAAPEHQVRALINKAMGHRNFRSFLNGYRMKNAQAELADPEKAGLPILTIAMDSGFASLSSFNRAFKETTGRTPSAFREEELRQKPPQN